MRLDELFNKVLPHKVTKNTEDEYYVDFSTDDEQYRFRAISDDTEPPVWEVSFAVISTENDLTSYDYSVNNKGNAYTVLATVLDIMDQFIHEKNPQSILLVADEPSRQKLYARMVRDIQGWNVRRNRTLFVLTRKDK